jgi:6-phospho-3-hexuloisomerase
MSSSDPSSLTTVLSEIEQVIHTMHAADIASFADEVMAAPRLFTTGEGRSGFMAKAFAMRLMHLGLTVYVVGETTTPALQAGDRLVAVSGSGTTAGTVHVAEKADQSGCTILTVTTNPESRLATLARQTIIIPAATKWRRPGEVTSEQPLGSLFDQCSHIALDAVCLLIAQRKGMSNETARQRHVNVE